MEPRAARAKLIEPYRVGRLLVRLLVLTALFFVPLILYTSVKRNFEFVKFITLRFYVFTALLAWIGVMRGWRDFASPGRAPWLLMLFGALLSCFCAVNLTECFDVHHVPDLAALFVFFQMVFYLGRSRRFVHLGAVLVAIQLAAASVYGLMQDLGIDRGLLPPLGLEVLFFANARNQAISTFGNINFAGEYQVAAFPVILGLLLSARKRWSRILLGIGAVAADWCFVAQDTEGSNLGFFFGLLVMVPAGMWVWPRRGKLLLAATAAGYAAEGVFTVFRDWWSRSYAFLLAARNPESIVLRNFDWGKEVGDRDPVPVLLERYREGREAFGREWASTASDIWVALALGAYLAVYHYGIPALSNRVQGAEGRAEEWVRRTRRRLLAGTGIAVAVLALAGGPLYVRHSIKETNEFLRSGGEVRKHEYAKVQPDAEHPYTLGHYFLDTVLSSWTYVFRWECWQAASANLVANRLPAAGVPILGIGPGNFKVTHPLFESHLERRLLGTEVLARKVHNDWLATGLEAGLFGILGQLWLYVVFFYCGYLVLGRLRARYAVSEGEGGSFVFFFTLAGIGSLVGTGFQNTVSSNLFQPSSAVMTYWVGACLCALAFPRRGRGAGGRRRGTIRGGLRPSAEGS